MQEQIPWESDQAIIYGKTITTKRKVAWYGDQPFEYTYSRLSKKALPWTAGLLSLKNEVEQKTGVLFHSYLLNLYRGGEEGMTWHSDAEEELKENGVIASISFRTERKFSFRHKRTGEKVDLWLEHGSLLVMKGII